MTNHGKIIKSTLVLGFALFYFVAAVPVVRTYPPLLKKAQSLGFSAKDCRYCHANSDGGTPFNARGNWLISEKKKRSVDTIDVSWLKEYGSTKKSTKKR
jgi:hypothetical protein